MIEAGTILQDRYTIERQIGVGGMGAVYLAVDQRFGNYVAIKETFYKDDEFSQAFEREAHLLNSLMHPVLPHVSDYFTGNEGHFLVMQFIEGEDLSKTLKRDGAFPLKDVLRWTDNLLDALDYLHSQNPPIIHRDIKPQNLKLTPRGDIILLDFGLAKLNSEDTLGVKSVFGYSRKYSPLEQIQGTGTDARSDIFALGATAYQLLTGKSPLDALTRASAIVAGKPDPLQLASEINNEIPIDVAEVLHTALKLNADQRFASAKAMRLALEYAVSANAAQNVEELPAQILPEAAGDKIINSAETESFPALEAFAAEAVNAPPETNGGNQTAALELPRVPDKKPLPEPEHLTQAAAPIVVPTKISIRPKQQRFPVAALAALLICAGLAAGYFINKANSPVEANETPITQSAPESNANTEQTTTVSEASAPELSEPPLVEKNQPIKVKSRSVEKPIGKPIEKTEPVQDSTETVVVAEKPKPSTPVRNKRRNQSERSGETRERVVNPPAVPDIETIFTGSPPRERDEILQRREERNRPRDEITEEEWRAMQRQRRERRRERQNRQNFPF